MPRFDARLGFPGLRLPFWPRVVRRPDLLHSVASIFARTFFELLPPERRRPIHLQTPQRLFVMDVPDGQDNNRALLAAFRSLPDVLKPRNVMS